MPLAGGTVLNADRTLSDLELVDLQDLGLGEIALVDDGRLRIGATATLDDICRSDLMPQGIRDRARAESPSTMRTLATLGGRIASGPSRTGWAESAFLAALLAHDTVLELVKVEGDTAGTEKTCRLDKHLSHAGPDGDPSLITAITIESNGKTAFQSTARTPADTPIVAVYGRKTDDGMTIAVSGASAYPIVVDPDNPDLDPPNDFRGSAQYRKDVSKTLIERVVTELND